MSRRLTTIPRAAKRSGVAAQTLYNHIRCGDFPVYEVPGQRAALVDLDEVAAYLAAKRSEALRRSSSRTRSAAYGDWGPNAIVRTLTEAEAAEVQG